MCENRDLLVNYLKQVVIMLYVQYVPAVQVLSVLISQTEQFNKHCDMVTRFR